MSERISAADQLGTIDNLLLMPYAMIKDAQELEGTDETRTYDIGDSE